MTEVNFDLILHPLQRARFLDSYLDHQPLFQPRKAPGFYSSLMTREAIDQILCHCHLTPDDLALVRLGEPAVSGELFDVQGKLDVGAVYGKYSRGATLVISSIDRVWAPLARFVRHLQLCLMRRCNVNLYLTPPRAQGFAPHFDHHDVLILQVEGQKHWRVHEPILQWPMEGEGFLVHWSPRAMESSESPDPVPPGPEPKPLLDVELTPGSLLYFPAGFVHEAFTGDSASLHLTVGVHPLRWYDLLLEVVRDLASRDPRLRCPLPPNLFSSATAQEASQSTVAGLLKAIAEESDVAQAIQRVQGRFLTSLQPVSDGHLSFLEQVSEVAPDTVVRRREGACCQATELGQDAVLRFPGGAIVGPGYLLPAFRFISAADAFRSSEIPDRMSDHDLLRWLLGLSQCRPGKLSATTRVSLVRRLIREGVLRPVL